MLARPIVALAASLLFAGCIDPANQLVKFEELVQNQLYVNYYEQNASSTGATKLPEYLRLTFNENRGKRIVFLNGHNIADEMQWNEANAQVKFADLKDFLREGENSVIVDPNWLFHASEVRFRLDVEGPALQVVDACIAIDPGCNASPNRVKLKIKATDASKVTSVAVNGDTGTLIDGLWELETSLNPAGDLFEVVGNDEHNHWGVVHYLKDGANIPNIFNARIKDSAIQGLKPMIEEQANATSIRLPKEDGSDPTQLIGKLLKNDETNGAIKIHYVRINELRLGNMGVGRVDFIQPQTGQTGRVDLDLELYPTVPWTKNDGTVSGNQDQVGTFLKATIWRASAAFGLCSVGVRDDDPANNGDSTKLCRADADLLIESVDVNGQVGFSVENSAFNVALGPEVDVTLQDAEGVAGGLSGLVATFKDLAVVKNMMKSVIQGVLNSNLQQIRIGAAFCKGENTPCGDENPENIAFDVVTEANLVSTENGVLNMAYSGRLVTRNQADNLVRSLGSYYESAALGDYLPGNQSNVLVSINANLINQALNTLYSTGLTHFTFLFNGTEPLFGPNEKATLTPDRRLRAMELIPAGPGVIRFHGTDTNQASLQYQNVTLLVSDYFDGEWKEKIRVNADIEAGVIMQAADGVLKMTVNYAPRLIIHDLKQTGPFIELPWLSLNVPDEFLMGIVKFGFDYIYPFLSDTQLTIDMPNIQTEQFTSKIKTDSFNTKGGHLKFNMSINTLTN